MELQIQIEQAEIATFLKEAVKAAGVKLSDQATVTFAGTVENDKLVKIKALVVGIVTTQ